MYKNIKKVKSLQFRYLIINGIYDKLLNDLINAELNVNIMENFIKSYVVIVKNAPNRHFSRKCKCPFKKWYVKMYHEIYKYDKIKNTSDDMEIIYQKGKEIINSNSAYVCTCKRDKISKNRREMKECKCSLDDLNQNQERWENRSTSRTCKEIGKLKN